MRIFMRQGSAAWVEEGFDHGLYKDNTPYFKSQYKISNTSFRVLMESTTEFELVMMVGDYLKSSGDNTVHLIMPFAIGARQDRRNKTGDVLFASKFYASVINSIGFDKVTVVDPHSEVMPALLDRVEIISAAQVLSTADRQYKIKGVYKGVIAPDAGAAKRAFEVAQWMNVPVYQGWKHRDVATGALTGFGSEAIPAGRYLLVDDICDGGGTFVGLASHIQDTYGQDKRIVLDLYVTHGVFSQGLGSLKTKFDKVITTDSYPQYYMTDVRINLLDMIG